MKMDLRFFPVYIAAAFFAIAPDSQASTEELLGAHEGWLDRMGGGIRELGRGNTGTSLEDAAPAAYWNPAVLGFMRRTQIALGTDIRTADRVGGFASVQGRAAGNLGYGLGVLHRGDFDVTAYDSDERSIGTARPQAIAAYLGLGLRTSRSNAFGVSVGWYSQYLDVGDGVGDVNTIGFVNLGWYRRFGEHWRTAVVIRNLGIDADLNAGFDQVTLGEENAGGFARTSSDFWPKTLVVAGTYADTLAGRPAELSLEILDYQLKPALYSLDANFHAQRLRIGGEWEAWPDLRVRTGMDGLNVSAGFGYTFRFRRRPVRFDYAITLEREVWTVNPMAVGLRYDF